jgi:hypothetical protein
LTELSEKRLVSTEPFGIYDGREHVLTSEHKQVTITELIWQNDKALEILRIEIKSAEK